MYCIINIDNEDYVVVIDIAGLFFIVIIRKLFVYVFLFMYFLFEKGLWCCGH